MDRDGEFIDAYRVPARLENTVTFAGRISWRLITPCASWLPGDDGHADAGDSRNAPSARTRKNRPV
ncbi:MAG: hypothetical protein IPM02_19950 [Betaproteobacteria bacterium]|nr:hypothetical protein [Betaproteobacteria bacterium]